MNNCLGLSTKLTVNKNQELVTSVLSEATVLYTWWASPPIAWKCTNFEMQNLEAIRYNLRFEIRRRVAIFIFEEHNWIVIVNESKNIPI